MNDFDNEEQSMCTMRGDTNEGTLGRIDQYDIIRKLGGGGFGVVYLVRDTQSDVEYAIKTLHPLLKSNPEEMENLRSQFKLVSKLIHSHIAPAMILHSVKEVVYSSEDVRKELRLSPGDFVMVMKYAPGVTLSQWRKQFTNGIVPVDKAIDICKQVASALDYAHSEKIIHRDIKPSNIIVETREGTPIARVLDFGLAAEIRSSMSRVSTEKGDTSGTRPYMAPEQWQGKKQGAATDQYALACMFYELVSGAVPFAGVFETGDFNAMMYAVENRTAEQLLELSTYQNKVLQRALSKNMTKRFASCGEFVNKLSKKHSGFRGKFLFVLLLCIVGAFVYTSKTKMPPVETLPQAQGLEFVGIERNDPLAEQPDPAPVSVDESLHKEESLSQEAPTVVQEEQPNVPEPAANSKELNSHLKPTLVIKAKCDGRTISGSDLVALDGSKYDIGEIIELVDGKNYGNAEINCKINDKNYYGKVPVSKVTWKGKQELVINLEEIKEQTRLTVAGIEIVRIPDSATHKGLYFGKYEVTQAQWQAIMGDNPSFFTGDSSHPVENVSWYDCQEFIAMLNARTEVKQAGITFRLPTEEEWEYAYRAGSKGKYGLLANGREDSLDEMGWYCDNSDLSGIWQVSPLDEMGWYCDNSDLSGIWQVSPLDEMGWYSDNSGYATHPVGQKKPNAWGLYDMHGNVWEWTASAFGSDRISRGGSRYNYASHCESGLKFWLNPKYGYYFVGFRLAASRTDY